MGCSGSCGSSPTSTPAPEIEDAGGVGESTGISVKLRWTGDLRDETVAGIEGVPECAEARPAGRLVLGEDSGLADAVVLVADAPGVPDVPAEVVLVATGCRFVPRAMVVPPSTPLILENRDSTLHTFHIWKWAEKGERNHQNVAVPPGVPPTRVVLSEPGRYRISSDRFSHMEAWILVAPSGTAGVTDADGRLELSEIPPGDHEVEILHPLVGGRIQQVTVMGDGPAALHVDLSGQTP
jgi:hypothetical protein